MIQRLYKEAGICNFHISTLNLERSTRLILEALHLHKDVSVYFVCMHNGVFSNLFDIRMAYMSIRYLLGHLFMILPRPNYGMNFLMVVTVILVHQVIQKNPVFFNVKLTIL